MKAGLLLKSPSDCFAFFIGHDGDLPKGKTLGERKNCGPVKLISHRFIDKALLFALARSWGA